MLEDVNDNVFEFFVDFYVIIVFENIELGMLLIRVQVIDVDVGLNWKILYLLIDFVDGQFFINELFGIIQLEKFLDREFQVVYIFFLKVVD